jgi:hypothetical protein
MKLLSLLVSGTATLAAAESENLQHKFNLDEFKLPNYQAKQFIETSDYVSDDDHSRSKRGVSSWRFYRKCLRPSVSGSCIAAYEEFAENGENAFGETVFRATEEAGSVFTAIPDRTSTRRVWAAYKACHNNHADLGLTAENCSNMMKSFLESYHLTNDCSAFGDDGTDWSKTLPELFKIMEKSDKLGKPQDHDNDMSHLMQAAGSSGPAAPPRADDCSAFLADDLSDDDVGTVYSSVITNQNPSGLGVYQLNVNFNHLAEVEKITRAQANLFAACRYALGDQFNTCNKCLILAEHNKTSEIETIISSSRHFAAIRAFLKDPTADSNPTGLKHDNHLGVALVTCTGMNYAKDLAISGSSFTTQQCCDSVGKFTEIDDTVYIPVRELGFNNLPGIPVKMFGTDYHNEAQSAKLPAGQTDPYTIPLDWVQGRGFEIFSKITSTECDTGYAENPEGKSCFCADFYCRPYTLRKSPGTLTAMFTAAKMTGKDLADGKISMKDAAATFTNYNTNFVKTKAFVNKETFPAFFWMLVVTNEAMFKYVIDSQQLTPFFPAEVIKAIVAEYSVIHVTHPKELFITAPGNRMAEYMKIYDRFEQSFTDARVHSEELWDWLSMFQLTANLHTLLVKADDDSLVYLKNKFNNGRPENGWKEEWTRLGKEGQLFFIDLTIFEHAIVDKTLDWWAPASILLLKRTVTDGKVKLLPFAVRISNPGDKESYVYEEKHGSTYIMALIGTRAALSTQGIELNHVTGYHVAVGLAAGTFQSATNGRKRTLLNDIFEKHFGYGMQFNTILFTAWETLIAPIPDKGNRVNHVTLLNKYMNRTDRGIYQWNTMHVLEKNRLNVEDFTNEGDIPWSGYYSVADGLALYDICENYVKKMLDTEYITDDDVLNDEVIEIWERLLLDKDHGNLLQLTKYGVINGRHLGNKAQLAHWMTTLMQQVLQHGRTRLQTGMNTLTMGRVVPHIVGNEMFKKPSDSYTVEEMLARLADLNGLGKTAIFLEVFVNTRPYGQMYPNGDPVKDGKNWYSGYPERSRDARRAQNKIAFDTARDIADWLAFDMYDKPRVLNGVTMKEGEAKYIDQLKQFPFKVEL